MRVSSLIASLFVSIASVTAGNTNRNPLHTIAALHDATILTPDQRIHPLSTFDIAFELHGRPIRLSLRPSGHDIIPEDAVVTHLNFDGSVISSAKLDPLGHKVYKGSAWAKNIENSWVKLGWARVFVYRDGVRPLFEGAFALNDNHHHLQLHSKYTKHRLEHDPLLHAVDGNDFVVLWRDTDISPTQFGDKFELRRRDDAPHTCQSDSLDFNNQPDHPIYTSMRRRPDDDNTSSWALSPRSIFGRQIDNPTKGNSGANLATSIGNRAGCPTTRKVALVGVAADCTYRAQFDTKEATENHIISLMNTASALYEQTFEITLGLRNLTVLEKGCPGTAPAAFPWNEPCNVNPNIKSRLIKFSKWRGSLTDSNSHWTLLSKCGTGTAVGLAWLGQVCTTGSQTHTAEDGSGQEVVAGANVVIWTQDSEWQTLAHETGHTFGAVHDCTSETCSDGSVQEQKCCPSGANSCPPGIQQYIMNPSTAVGIKDFSPCSIGNICSAMLRNSVKTGCLTNNRGVTTVAGPICGNGLVEQGEDCDCGGTEACGANPCCDGLTCKFKANAVCDDSQEDCCQDCRFALADQVCRNSTSSCDPLERCTGTSPSCPADITLPNGQSCGNDLKCASGQCTSRDLQCREIMGTYLSGDTTVACETDVCSLSCRSPTATKDTCWRMPQNFLDGTDCGSGGKCANGICQGSSVFNEFVDWVKRNPGIMIGVCVGGGILVLAILFCCCFRCIRRMKRKQKGPFIPYDTSDQHFGTASNRDQAAPSAYPEEGRPRRHGSIRPWTDRERRGHNGPAPDYQDVPMTDVRHQGPQAAPQWRSQAPPPVYHQTERYA